MQINAGRSLLEYLRQSVGIWAQMPVVLTVPLILVSLVESVGFAASRHASTGIGVLIFLFAAGISGIAGVVVEIFLSRLVADSLERRARDLRGAWALSLERQSLKTAVELCGWMVLWMGLFAIVVGLFSLILMIVGIATQHPIPHGTLRRPIVWILTLMFSAWTARYSFVAGYVAFARGQVARPVSLSVERTLPIRRALVTLSLCWALAELTISQLLVGAVHTGLAWNVLRNVLQGFPNALLAITTTLIAHADFLAMQSGRELVKVKAIEA